MEWWVLVNTFQFVFPRLSRCSYYSASRTEKAIDALITSPLVLITRTFKLSCQSIISWLVQNTWDKALNLSQERQPRNLSSWARYSSSYSVLEHVPDCKILQSNWSNYFSFLAIRQDPVRLEHSRNQTYTTYNITYASMFFLLFFLLLLLYSLLLFLALVICVSRWRSWRLKCLAQGQNSASVSEPSRPLPSSLVI